MNSSARSPRPARRLGRVALACAAGVLGCVAVAAPAHADAVDPSAGSSTTAPAPSQPALTPPPSEPAVKSTAPVVKANTTTTVTGPASTRAGTPITVKIAVRAVAPGTGTPGGTVTLWTMDGGESATLVNGTATITLTPWTRGQQVLAAFYTGSSGYNASNGYLALIVI